MIIAANNVGARNGKQKSSIGSWFYKMAYGMTVNKLMTFYNSMWDDKCTLKHSYLDYQNSIEPIKLEHDALSILWTAILYR